MSGPIVRSGPSTQYTENWDNIFGDKKPAKAKKKKATPAKKKASKSKKKKK